MKYLIILCAVVLLSCGKPQPPIYASGNDVCFYKITEVDINGKSVSTPVKRISLIYNAVNDDDHDGDEDEDDDDHDGCDTTVLPINISSFSLTLNGASSILINWKSENEQNTSHYVVERSWDAKLWTPVAQRQKDLGTYTVKDLISK
jgi:hypothetical protein